MPIDAPSNRLIQAVPDLAGEILGGAIDERLSRFHNRTALAELHGAYRAAQAKPDEFLQELDRNSLRHTDRLRARNGTKRAEVKERFVELVFCQSKGKRNWKKDSVCVDNWRSWGKPWFKLIDRFGRGILLVVPGEMTNRRQFGYHESSFFQWLYHGIRCSG